jgi:hypothetical protein
MEKFEVEVRGQNLAEIDKAFAIRPAETTILQTALNQIFAQIRDEGLAGLGIGWFRCVHLAKLNKIKGGVNEEKAPRTIARKLGLDRETISFRPAPPRAAPLTHSLQSVIDPEYSADY